MKIYHIAAIGPDNGIGIEGALPWRLKGDLPRFKKLTQKKAILMGRKTADSLGSGYLPNRMNLILSTQDSYTIDNSNVLKNGSGLVTLKDGVTTAALVSSLDEALQLARSCGEPELYVIGGGDVYAQTLNLAHELRITHAKEASTKPCDVFYPKLDPDVWQPIYKEEASAGTHCYVDYVRVGKNM